jgi:hypothetical protein
VLSDAIKKGDLVMVLGRPMPCGCISRTAGIFGIVSDVRVSWTGDIKCVTCKRIVPFTELIARIPNLVLQNSPYSGWYAVYTLKRIDPPALPESTTTERELVHER